MVDIQNNEVFNNNEVFDNNEQEQNNEQDKRSGDPDRWSGLVMEIYLCGDSAQMPAQKKRRC